MTCVIRDGRDSPAAVRYVWNVAFAVRYVRDSPAMVRSGLGEMLVNMYETGMDRVPVNILAFFGQYCFERRIFWC